MLDGKALGQKMLDAVKAYVDRETAALTKTMSDSVAVVRQEFEKSLAALPVPKDGANGKDAEPIHPDTMALLVQKAVSAAVADIPPAKDGEPGRDAAGLQILPDLDEAKSYAAGTWAKCQGGLVYARRKTNPLADGFDASGWEVMVEGIAGVVVAQGEDPRALTVAAVLTSGTKAIAEFALPMMIYRGIWKDGDYLRGDTTTWDGSLWHCEAPTKDKPGTSDAWKLCAKRGAPGKDSRPDAPPAPTSPIRLR